MSKNQYSYKQLHCKPMPCKTWLRIFRNKLRAAILVSEPSDPTMVGLENSLEGY
jgi:hypothetical protein